ncbi:MAG: homoserine dehydrogenase [Tyzzerella sp.]|uniref:Homoserine dehydrogenase n=1 Tax=Candidatus Fimicola merdigallinarum TaxID=2840819 RepID=A0A9D9DXF8_9FIRM|nr:homoserine dehydrogenase [Candidatus Fimicola merdigallinarum]
MDNIKVAILGIGTVGTGTYKIIKNQKDEFPYKTGSNIEVSKILVRDKSKKREGIDENLITDSWEDIINDDSISIVIEVMGGIEPAKTYITEALKKGKSVVTANKDLIASYGGELLDLAKENKCDILFEAAVAGGIPIIRPLKECLASNKVEEVMGIVNGTTNFILSKMTDEGMEFDEALKLAQKLGYAEADPTADVEGYDAGRKIAIMASIAFNSRVKFDDVYTEGISNISAKDIKYAKELDCEIKLLGVASNTDDGIEARVHPMLIPNDHPLSGVKDSFNAVFVKGDSVGDTMFYGKGAGELPTASAIVGDVIDVARNIHFGCCGRIGCTCYKNLPIKTIDDIYSKYFVRLQIVDKSGVLASVLSVLGKNDVSIYQLMQKKKRDNNFAEIVLVTDKVKEKNLRDSIKELEDMPVVHKVSKVIRVY